jgi:hypothetical protein
MIIEDVTMARRLVHISLDNPSRLYPDSAMECSSRVRSQRFEAETFTVANRKGQEADKDDQSFHPGVDRLLITEREN